MSLEKKDHVKYLGVLIDNNLSWKYHVDYITLKISKTIGIISRIRHYVPFSTLLAIYRSLIHPYISYGLPVWGQTSKTNLNKILVLQKRVLRLMFFATNREHAIPLFLASNILPINMLYFQTISVLMHDVNNNNAPLNIVKLFTPLSAVHKYNTRAVLSDKFYVQYGRTSHLNKSFSHIGTKIWNAIPEDICNSKKNLFKTKLKTTLTQILENEDVYLDLPKLILQISKLKH